MSIGMDIGSPSGEIKPRIEFQNSKNRDALSSSPLKPVENR